MMNMPAKRIVCLLSIIAAFGAVIAQEPDTSTVIRTGQEVPPFTVVTLAGDTVDMREMHGRVVHLIFFATWCGPCKQELEAVEKTIWPKYKGNKDYFLVAIGREHTLKEVSEFGKEKGLSFQLAADPGRSVYSLFARQFIPRNIIVGRDGKIAYESMGFPEGKTEELISVIEKALRPRL